jgi:hypothetical protein
MLNENDLTSNNAVGLPQSGNNAESNSLLTAGNNLQTTPASSDSTNTVNPYLDLTSGTDDTSLFTGSGY